MRKLLSLNKIEIEYDFSGSSDYLIIVVPNNKDIISYQIQMISNNTTEYFLPVKKVQINNRVQLYYNITNKVTLSQLLKTSKLQKMQLINIIECIISSMSEANEYQLEDRGIVLDKKYIYMESLDSNPFFIYIPFYSDSLGLKLIGNFVNELILDNVLENDNMGIYNEIINMALENEMSEKKFKDFIKNIKVKIQNDTHIKENEKNIDVAIDPDDYNPLEDFEINRKDEMLQSINLKDSYFENNKTIEDDYKAYDVHIADEKVESIKNKKVKPIIKPTEDEIEDNDENSKIEELNKSKMLKEQNRINKLNKIRELEELKELDRLEELKNKIKIQPQEIEMEEIDNTFETEYIDTESDFYKERELEINKVIKGTKEEDLNSTMSESINNKKRESSRPSSRNSVSNSLKPVKKEVDTKDIKVKKEKLEKVQRPKQIKTTESNSTSLIYFMVAQIVFLSLMVIMTLAKIFTDNEGNIKMANVIISLVIIFILDYILYKTLLQKDSSVEIIPSVDEIVTPSKEINNIIKPKVRAAKDTEAYLAKKQIEDTVFVGNKKMPYLSYEVDGVKQKIFITKDSFVIGRFVGQVDYVCESNKVGKIHAEIITRDGLYFINDLNSRNGTYINSYRQRIISNIDYPIGNSDLIILADVEFKFHDQ